MSELALHVMRLMNDPAYGRCLEADFRRAKLVAGAARLIAGEYEFDETPALPGA
ncbi:MULTISPECIES: hypothetical protein [Burkholderia]|uniref:hypothetical protein n=1 Tax=Burkholderia TaxID=32008 RepID=UPI00158C2EB2|nr:hypothetical protein [Burkholderia ambifaria]